jgi:uncharacterized protein
MIKKNLPKSIAVFPLTNAVFFPKTVLPLNIFEDRYVQLINDTMKENRMFGMIQPKSKRGEKPDVYKVGCLGKITSFNETSDNRFIITLTGIIRFRIKKENELEKKKLYRQFEVDYSDFLDDLSEKKDEVSINDKNSFIEKIKFFFEKINYPIRDNELRKLSMDQLISTVCMISPFSSEEKQKLIETINIENKLKILDEIINFNIFEVEENKTVQ